MQGSVHRFHTEDLKKERQKASKSYAERIRRGRINKCLEELKVAVLGSSYENVKMDQAAVLELSVQYFKLLTCKVNSPKQEEFISALQKPCTPGNFSPLENVENQANSAKKRRIDDEDCDSSESLSGSPAFQFTTNKTRRKSTKAKRLRFTSTKEEVEMQSSLDSACKRKPNLACLSQRQTNCKERKPFQDVSNSIGKKSTKFWRPW